MSRGRQYPGQRKRELLREAAESKTLCMRENSRCENRETPEMPLALCQGTVGEGRKPHVRHARFWGVGRPHSTDEAGEQSRPKGGGGVRGGKGIDQGEVLSVGHAPDTAPETAGRSGGQGYGPPLAAAASF